MHCAATVRVLTTVSLDEKDKLALMLILVLSVLAVTTNRRPIAAWMNDFFHSPLQISAAGIIYSEFTSALRRLLQCLTPARCPRVSPLQLCTHREGLLAGKRLAGERQRPVCHDCGEPRVRGGLLQTCRLWGTSAVGRIARSQSKFQAAKGHLRHALQNDAASRLAARLRGRQIISVEFLRSQIKAASWITFVVERTPQETGVRLVVGGQVSFFFFSKSGFLIMDVFLPKSIAGLLKRWSFLWLTEQRPTQMIATLRSLKIADQPACPCWALGLATEINRARTSKINYNNHSIILTESNGLSPETLSVCLYTALVLLMYYSGWWQFNKTIHFHKVRHQTNLVCCFFLFISSLYFFFWFLFDLLQQHWRVLLAVACAPCVAVAH